MWLATVRPDGRPHLTPIWFVWLDDRFWICTSEQAVKTRNARHDPRVMLSLESADQPAVAVGEVTIHAPPYPAPVVAAFEAKFSWDISALDDDEGPYDSLWEVTVARWLMGGSG